MYVSIENRLIYKKRDMSAKLAKQKLRLEVSCRSVQRYLNSLGWVKIKTRFCQVVSHKNRIHRIIYSFTLVPIFFKFLIFSKARENHCMIIYLILFNFRFLN